MKPGCTVKTITETEISASDGHAWVKVLLQEDTGSVVILSDYGNWSNLWLPDHRPDNLPAFLARLDADYAGGKFLGVALLVYDEDATRKGIVEHILEARRTLETTKEQAREHYDDLGFLDQGFDWWCGNTSLEDAWEWAPRTVMNHDWRNFWDRLWVPFVVPALCELGEVEP